jgi:hypothetical protein
MTVTTFNIASGSDDQYFGKSSGSWATIQGSGGNNYGDGTTTTIEVDRGFSSPNYYNVNAYLKWNTSSIPDTDAVSAATLRIYITSRLNPNTDQYDLLGSWVNWGTSPSGAYAFTRTADAFGPLNLSTLTTSSDNDFTLSNLSNISKTGTTYLVLSLDGTASPSGFNSFSFAGLEHTTQVEARLIITHAPTVTSSDSVGMIYA